MALIPRAPVFLHGGDYNPDQWLEYPEILKQDIEYMKKAHVNCVSVGIFAWSALEPEDGVYDFDWLEKIIDDLYANGIYTDLATPSGARPPWLAQKYPEVLRVNRQYQRMHYGDRHNHCLTSPVYRRKVREMDTLLAKRFGHHPGVVMWHLSNEYGGECRCPLCLESFRGWLKKRYGTLEELNRRWWSAFWSHRYTDWSQIEAPSENGDRCIPAMKLDWERYTSDQCKDFMTMERDAVKAVCPDLPVTANLMSHFRDYDYFSLAENMDIVSWDAYPAWTGGSDGREAAFFSFDHDVMRSLKDQPFLLMESVPSSVNWKPVNKLKRPGMHLLSSMMAVAHGSQSVMYFQWRKGRGGAESFHGAVVDHDGRCDGRVFRDVTQVGEALEKLQPVYDVPFRKPQVCLIYDWNNRWMIDHAEIGLTGHNGYMEEVDAHYRALWQMGINVDIRDMRECTDLSGYKLVVAPMLFMFRNGFADKLRAYVENGGTLLTTYFSGMVDDTGLAFLGGMPGKLTDVLGVRDAELDALYPDDVNAMIMDGKRYPIKDLAQIPELLGAEVIGTYADDFYAGMPCLTRNSYGKGIAWHQGARLDDDGLAALYARLVAEAGVEKVLDTELPQDVTASARGRYVFLQNYSGREQDVVLPFPMQDVLTDTCMEKTAHLPVNGLMILVPTEVKA